jgi:5-methylcytosine-specific restriction endonuclease McrA
LTLPNHPYKHLRVALSKNQKPKISEEEMRLAIDKCTSWAALTRLLRGNDAWGNIRTLKRYADYYGLDTSKLNGEKESNGPSHKYKPHEIFIENSPAPNTVLSGYFRRLYPPIRCAECGTGNFWNGRPLTLHIDHINGHGTDWRLENCRYLCPNCHYQTDTHGTKRGLAKRKGEIKVTPMELSDSLDEHGCYKTVGLIYGLSDRTVKNMIKKYRRYIAD